MAEKIWSENLFQNYNNDLRPLADRLIEQQILTKEQNQTLTILWAPGLVLPGSEGDSLRQWLVHALPVHTTIAGLRNVGENSVFDDGLHGVGVGFGWGAGRHSEKAVLRVDGT